MKNVKTVIKIAGVGALMSMLAACASTTTETGPGPHSTFDPAGHASVSYFAFNRSDLVQGAKNALDLQAAFLKANKAKFVQIQGYADSRGTEQYNIALSARRAHSVSSYLRAKGYTGKIVTKAYGKMEAHQYNADDTSEMGYALNRRVIACDTDAKNCADKEKNPLG